jgi:hypothetical protein
LLKTPFSSPNTSDKLVAHLPWAHLNRFQRLHPFRRASNISNNLGNLLFAQRYPQCLEFEEFWYSFGTADDRLVRTALVVEKVTRISR